MVNWTALVLIVNHSPVMDRRTTITVAIGALMVFRSSARLISSVFSLRLNRNLQIWCFLSRVAISDSDADNTITPLSSMVLAVSEENPASIRKSGPEIKNRRTLKDISGENPASIRKSGPEIKNRCTLKGILQAEPFSFAATKISIGRGPRSRYDRSRQNHSLLPQRKLESYAENRCRYDCSRRNHFLSRQRRAGGF